MRSRRLPAAPGDFHAFEKALRGGWGNLAWIKQDTGLDPLHEHRDVRQRIPRIGRGRTFAATLRVL
jgi:hypothetical protein